MLNPPRPFNVAPVRVMRAGAFSEIGMVNGNAGKGDRYRKVDHKKYAENWEKAFGKKEKKNGRKKSNRSSDSRTPKRS